MGPTVDAWLHFTSFVSMSRLGTLSAQAPCDSVRLRLVWNAAEPLASLWILMRPVYTLLAVSCTAPLNSRSLVVRGDTCSCNVRKSCICVPPAKYNATCRVLPP